MQGLYRDYTTPKRLKVTYSTSRQSIIGLLAIKGFIRLYHKYYSAVNEHGQYAMNVVQAYPKP